MKNNTSLTFNTSNGLSGNIVTDFVEDSFGHVWVGCFNAPTLSKIKENSTEKINFSNGAEESLTFALEKDVFDNIWIGTGVFGLYRYDGAVVNRTIDGHPGNTIRALLNDRNGNLWVGSSSGLAKYLPSVN